MLSKILLVLKFLPELIDFIKLLESMINEGFERAEIKRKTKQLQKSFKNRDRQKSAEGINDVFRGAF